MSTFVFQSFQSQSIEKKFVILRYGAMKKKNEGNWHYDSYYIKVSDNDISSQSSSGVRRFSCINHFFKSMVKFMK